MAHELDLKLVEVTCIASVAAFSELTKDKLQDFAAQLKAKID